MAQGSSIVRYFHKNERFDNVELSGVAKNIGDHISQLFPSGAIGEALILFFQSKQFIESLGMTILRCTFMLFCCLITKSLKPYQKVKIETLRCWFVFLSRQKF